MIRFRDTFLCFFFLGLLGSSVSAEEFYTEQELLGITPQADPALVRALVENQHVLEAAEIESRLRVAHFLAQVMTETGGLRRLDENMNYSAARLTQVFSRRVITPEKALEIERQPRLIANWVYGNRLGNRGRHTDDGWNFRGSGYIQLTGRDNFLRRGAEIGQPLEESPEIARGPITGLTAATAYWRARAINAPADCNKRREVRVLVNGPAAHGLNAAIAWFNRIWTTMYADRPEFARELLACVEETDIVPTGDTDDAVAAILVEEGFLSDDAAEASDAGALSYALRAYQSSRGLEETGTVDEDTFYALTDPSEWRVLGTARVRLGSAGQPQWICLLRLGSRGACGADVRAWHRRNRR